MDIPHLFTHSSVDGHSGCLYFGAVMDNDAKRFMFRFFSVNIFSDHTGIYFGVELLDHMVTLYLNTYTHAHTHTPNWEWSPVVLYH